MARTIVSPLRMLARATTRVRQGRDRQVEVPRLPARRDEIGQLARAISDMSAALRQRIDAVEHFAADVAHEIKNPLASLRSALESLALVEDKDLRRQLNDIAAHDVRRIDRLVSEISEASRIDAEMSRATFERIDLVALAENIVNRREARDQNGGHAIVFTRPDRGARVPGLPIRLERVIDNLLDNAVSFSPEGAPIDLVIERGDGVVSLSVSDRGPGIPEDAREKVFRRFHSDRPEDEGFGQHSGLGLAIARTIAEAHDGALLAEARSDGERGARMVLTLPDAEARGR
jgi:two-component system sensor histidine kinase ChvG